MVCGDGWHIFYWALTCKSFIIPVFETIFKEQMSKQNLLSEGGRASRVRHPLLGCQNSLQRPHALSSYGRYGFYCFFFFFKDSRSIFKATRVSHTHHHPTSYQSLWLPSLVRAAAREDPLISRDLAIQVQQMI